ncbi:helix-turn-helix domain-containing protein [Ensifer sp. MJa1]|uniref:helix-turn-helix domain-containing protein n=1 Tax=Ensifer sp. MJa1 TaxID=2919888 RepID=UPI003009C43B
MPDPILEQFCFTVTQAAKVLGRHKSTIYRLVKDGHIKTRQTVVGPVIMRSEIMRHLSEMPVEPEDRPGPPLHSPW